MVCLDILNGLLNILGRAYGPGRDIILKGLFAKHCLEVHLGGTNRVRLQWEEAGNLVHDMLGVIVDHEQVVYITEDAGVILLPLWVSLFLESHTGVSRA